MKDCASVFHRAVKDSHLGQDTHIHTSSRWLVVATVHMVHWLHGAMVGGWIVPTWHKGTKGLYNLWYLVGPAVGRPDWACMPSCAEAVLACSVGAKTYYHP